MLHDDDEQCMTSILIRLFFNKSVILIFRFMPQDSQLHEAIEYLSTVVYPHLQGAEHQNSNMPITLSLKVL